MFLPILLVVLLVAAALIVGFLPTEDADNDD